MNILLELLFSTTIGLYCAGSKRKAIAFKALTTDTVVDVDKLTVEKLKGKV